MRTRKLAITATILASTFAAAWAGNASASCTLCFPDPLTGKVTCFENMCAHLKTWLEFPPDAQIKSPIDIASFARELQNATDDPATTQWILVSQSTKRQFILDLQRGTMTEVVAGTQGR